MGLINVNFTLCRSVKLGFLKYIVYIFRTINAQLTRASNSQDGDSIIYNLICPYLICLEIPEIVPKVFFTASKNHIILLNHELND